jgi:hypothetical protein
MNIQTLARMVGIVALVLGVAGMLLEDAKIVEMNMDLALDVTRIALGGLLIVGSFGTERSTRGSFAIFGTVYLAAFIAGFISPSAFGLFPNQLSALDNTIHLIGGLFGLGIATQPEFLPIENRETRLQRSA